MFSDRLIFVGLRCIHSTIHSYIAYIAPQLSHFNIIMRYTKNKISCLFCCINICVLRAPRSNLIYTQVFATLTLFQVCKHFLLMKQILTFSFSTMRYCDSPVRFCAVFTQSQNKFLHKTSQQNRNIAYNTLVTRKMLEFALFNRIIPVMEYDLCIKVKKRAEI